MSHNHTVGVSQEECEKETKRIIEEIMPENFSQKCKHPRSSMNFTVAELKKSNTKIYYNQIFKS